MNHDAIPQEMRDRRNWVVWRNEKRSGKWTKVPYRVDGRTKAAVDNPQTWATFEQVMAVSPATVQGIGYVFSVDDPFAGVDLDACRNPATGEVHPAAAKIVNELDSYTEISPSGTGLHIIVRATLAGGGRRTSKTLWEGEFEVYDRGRFFTMTGNGEGEPSDAHGALDALVVQLFGEASRNGAGPSSNGETGDAPEGTAQEVLDRHEDLAKVTARKGTKPKGGTPSDWDFMLGCRAAEYGYDDATLAELIRRARRLHGEDKGERDDYVARTIAAVRQRVGYVGTDSKLDVILAELTKALRLDGVDRRVVLTRVAGHGNTAAATIVLDDGYEIRFSTFEHVAHNRADSPISSR